MQFMTNHVYDIAVIGAGAAGSMGALRAVLNNLDTLIFEGSARNKKSARATWVGKVENMPVLFDRPKAVFSSSKEVFDWIQKQEQWSSLLQREKDGVTHIEKITTEESFYFKLNSEKGKDFYARYVLICTGIMDKQPEIGGSISPIFPMANEGHIEYCIRCDGHKSKGKKTVVIGHQETAAWVASLLYERYRNPAMTILTNGNTVEIDKSSEVLNRLRCYKIGYEEEPIVEILGDPKNSLKGFQLKSGKVVEAEMAFVSLGTIVHNQLAKDLECQIDERGYVETDASGESSVSGVFIGGDLRANKKKQIYTAWDITVDAVDKIDSYIRQMRREVELPDCSNKPVIEKVGDLFGEILTPSEWRAQKF